MVTIYALKDPKTNEVKYIGKTSGPLYKRLSSHYVDKKRSYKKSWIDSLKKQKIKPLIVTIEECEENVWQEREKFWISYYRKIMGNKLTNILEGGNGLPKGYKHSQATKEKIRASSKKCNKGWFLLGSKQKKETRKKIEAAVRKPILQYTLEGYFIKQWPGTVDASKKLKIDKNNIQSCLKQNTQQAGGFVWRRYENNFPLKIYPEGSKHWVLQYDKNGVFIKLWSSFALVEREFGFKKNQLWNWLNNKCKNSSEYIWKRYEKNFLLKLDAIK